jgi:hypothetical protein
MSWVNIAGTDVTGAALTETDDTNVTLTLGGTPSTALLRSVSMTLGWAGQLAVSRGGTGAATLTGVLIGNGTSAFTAVTGGPNQILRVNGTATGYEFYTASFLTNPMTLNYDMIYQSGGVPARLPGPTSTTKQFLTAQGNGTATTSLAWGTIDATDITAAALTKVDDTNVTLTLGGTPATSLIRAVSLTLGWSGTLAVSRGGTGASTLTGVVIGNGTSAMTAVAGTAGQFLRRNTANTSYEFRTLQGGDISGSELTKTDDTNVTISLGGTPASALLQPVSLTMGWTGQLSVSRGGTGASSLTGVLIGNGTSAVSAVAGTAGQLLRRNAANTAYEFFTASLISGNGVTDRVAKWTSSTNLIDGVMIDDGTNVGVGISPLHKLDVGGAIGLSGVIALTTSGNYRVLYDTNAVPGLYIGSSTAAENLYNNTTHKFNNKAGTTNYATLSSTDMTLNGIMIAGSQSSANGSIILQDNYSVGHLTNLCSNYSSGSPVLAYGATTSTTTQNAFVSATTLTIQKAAITIDGAFYFRSASSASVAVGSAVTMTNRFTITNGGQMVLPMYTSSSSMPGTAAGVLAFDSIGSIITIAAPSASSAGTYTPTWNALTNIDSITAYSCQYLRVGDTVTVSGYVGINATVDNTPTSAEFTVPVNSALSTINFAAGVGVQDNGGVTGSILGYASNKVQFEFTPTVDTMVYYSFHFTYRIV